MFIWNVEDMALLNQNFTICIGNEKIYNCEREISREDKIAFVDKMNDGKLSYILLLADKYAIDKETMPKDSWGTVKTVSLKAWIKKNDTKYNRPIFDNSFKYGQFYLLGIERHIEYVNSKRHYDTYEDLVDEAFHRQLKKCEEEERLYFLAHDEYSILKQKYRDYHEKYRTSFGVHLSWGSKDINIWDDNSGNKREITIEELKELLSKYEQIDALVEKLTAETHIVY